MPNDWRSIGKYAGGLFIDAYTNPATYAFRPEHFATAAYKMFTKKRKSMAKARATGVKRRKPDYQRGRELSKPTTELKAFDQAYTNQVFSSVAAGGQFSALNLCVNGPELYQRVGRKIYMKSVHIRGLITFSNAACGQDNNRIMVIYDSQPNAALPALATIIQDSTAAAGTSILSEINLTNRQRFKILRDTVIPTPAVTFVAGQVTVGTDSPLDAVHPQCSYTVDWFIKLKGLETIYNGVNGGTIADIASGSLLLVNFAGNNNGLVGLGFTSRLRYYD